jgi:SAM-dependent methyltransferase
VEFDADALGSIDPADRGVASFVRGDAMRLPLATASVDVAICAQVYEHVPDDRRLFAEIDRVLKPGAVLFFSGPNWLFPVEPHYFLPFLHWLPEPLADRYLRAVKGEPHYYERSRTFWSLRGLLSGYRFQDVTRQVLRQRGHPVGRAPALVVRAAQPLLPNFNWLAQKPT